MKTSFIALILAALLLSSCSEQSDAEKKQLADMNNEISMLKIQNQVLNDKVEKIDSFTRAIGDITTQQLKFAYFTPGSKGYQVISTYTDDGKFFVSLDKITKYVDGYKLIFSIGNPSLITYNDFKIRTEWGNNTNSTNINKPILPGTWNKVEVILSPAAAKDLSEIKVSLETGTVFLNNDYRQTNS